jgi:hypothetical protein
VVDQPSPVVSFVELRQENANTLQFIKLGSNPPASRKVFFQLPVKNDLPRHFSSSNLMVKRWAFGVGMFTIRSLLL